MLILIVRLFRRLACLGAVGARPQIKPTKLVSSLMIVLLAIIFADSLRRAAPGDMKGGTSQDVFFPESPPSQYKYKYEISIVRNLVKHPPGGHVR